MGPPEFDHVSRVWSYSGPLSAVHSLSPTGRLPSVVCGSTQLRLTNGFVTPARPATTWTQVLQPRPCNGWPLAHDRFRLIPFRSPLLRESRLISFPRGT